MLRTFSVPIAIVVAGGLIAASIYFVNVNRPYQEVPTVTDEEPTVLTKIRGLEANDHVLGNPKAEIVIVEFSDPECPFCKQFHGTMHRVIDTYGKDGKVAWVYRHFPIPQLHPKAQKEAEALECAAELGGEETFWKYADRLYEITPSNNGLDIGAYNSGGTPAGSNAGQLTEIATFAGLDAKTFETCLASGRHAVRVKKDADEAVAAGGRGTPHSILIAGDEQTPVEGAQPFETLKGIIDSLL